MRVIRFFLRRAGWLFWLAAAAGIVSGASTISVLVFLFRTLTHGSAEVDLSVFLALIAFAVTTRTVSRALFSYIGRNTLLALRTDLAERLVRVSLIDLERLGSTRLMGSLSEDIGRLSGTVPSLELLFANSAIVALCLSYLAWLSLFRFVELVVLIIIGLVSHHLLQRKGIYHLRDGRRKWDELLAAFRALVEGNKELKLSAARRQRAMRTFEGRALQLKASGRSQSLYFGAAASWAQLFFLIAIGLVIFSNGRAVVADAVLVGYGIAVIYLMGPIQALAAAVRGLSEATVPLERLQKLELELNVPVARPRETTPLDQGRLVAEEIKLMNVVHAYDDDGAGNFVLGPVNLTIKKGQVLFITGGNGVGKTTLGKMLVGLYAPTSGEIRLNGRPVVDTQEDLYRRYFSAVFSDAFLFGRQEGADELCEQSGHLAEVLTKLNVAGRANGEQAGSQPSTLSAGERKRLCLLQALGEDRPILLFDESAAELDPIFKDIFYRELLPALRSRGKIAIVISHDDRYFDVADQVLQLERGLQPIVKVQERGYVPIGDAASVLERQG